MTNRYLHTPTKKLSEIVTEFRYVPYVNSRPLKQPGELLAVMKDCGLNSWVYADTARGLSTQVLVCTPLVPTGLFYPFPGTDLRRTSGGLEFISWAKVGRNQALVLSKDPTGIRDYPLAFVDLAEIAALAVQPGVV